jgi:nitrite reductase/ring-hydroxylating ferredoxin subunit
MMREETFPVFLCRLENLPEYGTRGFSVDNQQIFVIRQATRLRAYINRCPHTGVTLNWLPDQFLDLEGRYIQCATHGALFRIEDGRCMAGPCPGAYLEPVPLTLVEGKIYVINCGIQH